jgi:hypothetical protein
MVCAKRSAATRFGIRNFPIGSSGSNVKPPTYTIKLSHADPSLLTLAFRIVSVLFFIMKKVYRTKINSYQITLLKCIKYFAGFKRETPFENTWHSWRRVEDALKNVIQCVRLRKYPEHIFRYFRVGWHFVGFIMLDSLVGSRYQQ